MKLVAALVVLAIAMAGCTGDERVPKEGLSGTCGLPKIKRNVEADRVAPEFLLEDVEIANTQDAGDRFIATVNAPYAVNDAYRQYLDQVKQAGWDIVTHETEGFEAEIYLSDPEHLAAVQIRTSTCKEKAVVFVSIVDREETPSNN